MGGWVSTRTAERALVAFDVAIRLHQSNGGGELGPEFTEALRELHAAAAKVADTRQKSTPPAESITVEHMGARKAAERLGCSTRTVERHAAAGKIPAIRVGGRWLIEWTDDLIEMRRAS